jgi:hypothetical protein
LGVLGVGSGPWLLVLSRGGLLDINGGLSDTPRGDRGDRGEHVSVRSWVSVVLSGLLLGACQGQPGELEGALPCVGESCGADVDADGTAPEVDDVAEVIAEPEVSRLVREAKESGLLKYIDEGAVPTIESVDGDTTVFAFGLDDGPLCMRGEPYRFSFRDTGSDKLLIFLQGGGTCWSDFCLTVIAAAPGIPIVESLDIDNPSNPMSDWSVLYLPYCDGSFFAGDRDFDEDGNGTGDRFHRGLQNFSGALRTIRELVPDPERVLLTGSSAGAFGTIPGTVFVRAVYPHSTLQVFNDSGVGIARPGEVAFIEKILDEQGLIPLIPETCEDCWGDGHITRLVHWIFERDPEVQMAVFSSVYDSVIAGTFLNIEPEQFKEALLTETQALHDRFPDRYKRFIVQGTEHTALLGTPIGIIGDDLTALEYSPSALSGLSGIRLGGLDSTTIGEVSVGDWLRAFVEGGDGWDDMIEPEAVDDTTELPAEDEGE